MSERRMFAKSIVLSDEFLSMPTSSQVLYFHLGMVAQNKGFLNNAVSTARCIGADITDLQILIDNGYLMKVDDGYEITHWYENNGIGETAKKRNNYKYRQWRAKIIDRDRVCKCCGSKQKLEVHHKKHFADFPELRMNDGNAITLCYKCHKELHRRERNGKKENV